MSILHDKTVITDLPPGSNSRTDSGFLSGNLVSSSELLTEELEEKMRLNNGMDLEAKLSGMVLKDDAGYNDLNGAKSMKVLEEEQHPWELYFEQDEEGDT